MFRHIPYFQQQHAADMARVDKVVLEQVQSDVVLIEQVGQHIINSGGKRLRPIALILAGKALGFDGEELYRQAAMVEFIHTSTLLHDDVVDESELRRGKPTANNLFGNAAAVLVGDFLYTRAFQLMVGTGSLKIMQVMADATNVVAAGEVMQLMNIGNSDLSEAEYMEVIKCKTAKLFEAATQVGALLASASPTEEHALQQYGMHLGTAFQIIDDILDYSGKVEEIGKNLGDDLAEGKATLPLIYLMRENGDNAIGQRIRHALENADNTHFVEIHRYVVESDALAYCRFVAQKSVDAAKTCLSTLPENRYTEAMTLLLDASLNRIQ